MVTAFFKDYQWLSWMLYRLSARLAFPIRTAKPVFERVKYRRFPWSHNKVNFLVIDIFILIIRINWNNKKQKIVQACLKWLFISPLARVRLKIFNIVLFCTRRCWRVWRLLNALRGVHCLNLGALEIILFNRLSIQGGLWSKARAIKYLIFLHLIPIYKNY